MELVSPDRRVLKAFYTQYVAVLLIILTFTIGAFRRTLPDGLSATAPTVVWAPRAVVGSLSIAELFRPDGAVNPGHPQLAAIREVLQQHDLTLKATYLVPRLQFDHETTSLRRAFRRLESLRGYLRDSGVPEEAAILLLQRSDKAFDSVDIHFIDSGGHDELR